MTARLLRIGSRGSRLAMWQAGFVSQALSAEGIESEIIPITTKGDQLTGSLRDAGGEGLFTKAIQEALLHDAIDVAVHSLKDLATQPVPGLALAAVPARASAADVLASDTPYTNLDDLPQKARIGTGSPRRSAQLLHYRPDLEMVEIRGNVESRLQKLQTDQLDAVVLAEAGLARLERTDRISLHLPMTQILPAAGQGALGIEIRERDVFSSDAVRMLDDPISHACIIAERTILEMLRAGCLAPVGVWARPELEVQENNAGLLSKTRLRIDAAVLSADGKKRVATTAKGVADDARFLGQCAAGGLEAEGALDLIRDERLPQS